MVRSANRSSHQTPPSSLHNAAVGRDQFIFAGRRENVAGWIR